VDNDDLIRRYRQLESERTTIEQAWQLIEKYAAHYRGDFFQDHDEHSIDWVDRDTYDSTAPMALQVLAASLHGALTSPSIRWFQLRFRDKELNEAAKARQWLQSCADEVYWALQDSNFNQEVNEAYLDLVGYGTAHLMLEEGDQPGEWGGLQFSAVPTKEGYFENGPNGGNIRFYRCIEWTPAQILAKFGDKVPDMVKDLDEKGNQTRLKVLFVVVPRNNRVTSLGKQLPPSKRAFEKRYILVKNAETLGKPGGYYEMPVYSPRWRKTSESMWGNSPAMIALPDIMTVNKARMLQLEMGEKLLDPPTFADERAVIGDELDLTAGAHNTMRDINGVKWFDVGANIPVSDMMIEQLQQAIRDYFFIDQLRMPQPQAQPMTATEVQLRYEQMQRLLGPTLGRLQSDLLDPLVGRVFRMLARAGRLPEPPDIVIEKDPDYDVEYLGSLSRSQKMDEVAAIERWVMMAAQLGEVLPELLDVPDPVEIMRKMGIALNVPGDVMRDKAAVKQRQDERKQREDAMMDSQQQQMEGDAAQSLAAGEEALGATGGQPNGEGRPA
jgi:hypothetical protein